MATNPLPESFLTRLQEIKEGLKAQPFFILLWGPGEGEGLEKRQRIREFLANHFGQDSVFMSEDEEFQDMRDEFGLRVAEAIQAAAIDAVVVLNTSIGSHTEIVTYEYIIARKALVFVSHEHRDSDSFAAIAYDFLRTEGYTEEEYKSCENICRKANLFAQTLRFKKAERDTMRKVFGGEDT